MTVAARTMAGVPDSVAEARRWVADVLRGRGDAWLAERAVLIVSELVTNAVKYAGGQVRVELSIGVGRIRVSVIDTGTNLSEPMVPRARPDPDDAEAPRGLYLVDLWAERVRVCGGPRGRSVHADVATGSSASGRPQGDEAYLARTLPRRIKGAALAEQRGGFV